MTAFLLSWKCVPHSSRLIFILGILLFATGIPYASAREVRVGIYENSPKVFTDNDGKPMGIFVDIIEEIARREGWSLLYVPASWPQCLANLETGVIDLMVDVAYSPERAKKYDFCINDILSNWAQVYTRSGVQIRLITDLAGMRLVTLREGIHLVRLNNLAEGFGFHFNLTQVDNYEAVFRMIHEKKADAGIVNRVYGYAHEDQYDVIRSPVVFSPASLRFAVKKGDNGDVITAIDRQLVSLKTEKSSVYHQSLRRWLGETTKLNLPEWIGWSLGAAAAGILLLFMMSILLKHQITRKTEHLRLANAQLEKQVSETMKAHLELKRSEEQLIRQERLSALGQLTSGIAHDFNNMLIPILGYSDLLLESPELLKNTEKILPMLQSIRAAAGTSRETVKRLQEFNRADSRPKMEKVNVAKLVSEVVQATKPLWKSDKEAHSVPVRIIEDIPSDLMVTVSRSQFSEAVMNLLLNALHAISSGGEVTISSFMKDEKFILQVKDTGIGMSKDVARRCLEPFFSTKGENGTGMGLAMVHGIVMRHNGSLNIHSIPGKGTTIDMQIPFTQEDTESQQSPRDSSQVAGSLKVLVVDDDENSRTLLSEYFALDGHSITTAVDTIEGMTKFDRNKFDLVVTDRAMPKISGDKLALHVKASDHRVPVLMITGFAHIMASQGEHPEGVDCILAKPFTVQELRSAIERTFRSSSHKK